MWCTYAEIDFFALILIFTITIVIFLISINAGTLIIARNIITECERNLTAHITLVTLILVFAEVNGRVIEETVVTRAAVAIVGLDTRRFFWTRGSAIIATLIPILTGFVLGTVTLITAGCVSAL
jgi:hypothetical protein